MNRPLHEKAAADALAALGNRTRLGLFRLLVRAGRNGLNVGQIQSHMDIPASTLAHHLATLTRAGMVTQERDGRETISRAAYEQMDGLIAYLTEQCCAGVQDKDSSAGNAA